MYDLQTWMGAPSLYVYDCSNAGVIVDNFKSFAEQHEKEYEVGSLHTHIILIALVRNRKIFTSKYRLLGTTELESRRRPERPCPQRVVQELHPAGGVCGGPEPAHEPGAARRPVHGVPHHARQDGHEVVRAALADQGRAARRQRTY